MMPSAMIAQEIQTIAGREVDRRSVRIPAPIRTLGKYSIPVQFADDVDASLDVLIEPDEDSVARIEQAKQAREEAAAEDPTFEEALEQESAEGEGDSESSEADAEEKPAE